MLPSDVIKKYGWNKFGFGDDHIGYCVIGAWGRCFAWDEQFNVFKSNFAGVYADPKFIEFRDALGRVLDRKDYEIYYDRGLDRYYMHIPNWNDHRAKSKEEVVAALMAAEAACGMADPEAPKEEVLVCEAQHS